MQRTTGLSYGMLLLVALSSHAPMARAQTTPPGDIDAFVEQVRARFEVPGIGLAVVKDGAVVLSRGYGFRAMGQPDRIDAHTRFGIASNTKAFTATALGLLVEEGKLAWDAPVIDYLPWFQMWDPWVTREITVRDILVHRSGLGLGQGDLLGWPPSTLSREEIVYAIRYLKPITSFRSAYAYDNVLYHVAALVIEAVSGQAWEAFVTDRIVQPLGMTDTRVTRASTRAGGNVATPHARLDGRVQPIEPFDAVNTNASGGINASAADMARWLMAQLDSGRVAQGPPLFTPKTTEQLWTPVTPRPINNPPPELAVLKPQFNGYALGFGVTDYRGHKVVSHTGSLPGYVSQVTMIPDLKLGVVVLTNQESGAAYQAITYHLIDHYLGASDVDWLPVLKAREDRARTQTAISEQAVQATRDSTSRPSLPLASYAGVYADAWYGDITLTEEGGGLVMRFSHTPALVGDLAHWQHDTFVVHWRDRTLRADAFVTFALTPEGHIEQARMLPVSPAIDFSYDFQDLLLKPAHRSSE